MKPSSPLLLLLAACGAAAPVAHGPALTTVAPDAARLLDAWAQAAGGRQRLARVAAVHVRGRATQGGLEGPYDLWETARGERREEIDLGGVERSTEVFDGARGWLVDRNGAVRDLDGPELDDDLALAYLGAWAALVPERRPGTVSRGDAGAALLQPAGGRILTVTFDPATHLPRTISRPSGEKTLVVTLSDWREVGGVRYPFLQRTEDGDPRDAREVRVEAVTLDAAAPAAAFARPPDRAPDFRFAAGGTTTVPIEIVNSLIFVRAQVNAAPPLDLILDTGAEVTVLNESRLAKLGLAPVGKLAVGAGGGNVALSYVKDVGFALPGVTLAGQIVAAVPLDGLEPLLGRKIDGILGYDFLSRFVVEVDYAGKTLRLSDPRGWRYAGGGEAVPITLEGSTPYAQATVELAGREKLTGRFTVDTGCTCTVSFFAPYTRVNRMLEAVPKVLEPPPGSSAGAGGVTESVTGRIAAVTVGTARLPDPIADFSKDETGATADPDAAGLIGGQLLSRFIVTFDYSRKTMFLEKTKEWSKRADAIGSGIMWILAGEGGKDLVVAGLVKNSPGAEAGLQLGDVLLAVDGKAARDLGKVAVDDLLHTAGKSYKLKVRRGAKEITAAVAPRELL